MNVVALVAFDVVDIAFGVVNIACVSMPLFQSVGDPQGSPTSFSMEIKHRTYRRSCFYSFRR